jgi:hypothetical protein
MFGELVMKVLEERPDLLLHDVVRGWGLERRAGQLCSATKEKDCLIM